MRRLLPLLATLALAGSLAACDASVSSYAAKVDGATISQGDINHQLSLIAHNADFSCLINANAAVNGAGVQGTYSADIAGFVLNQRINAAILERDLAARHATITPLARSTAKLQLESNFGAPSGSSCTATGAETVASLQPELSDLLVTGQAAADALSANLAGEPLTTAGVTAYGNAHPRASESDCLNWIVTSNKATATQLRTSIAQGASFATVAKASSIDTSTGQNGGAVGCPDAVALPAPLNTVVPNLAINAVSAPLAFTESGTTYYLLLQVTSRKTSTTAATEALLSAASTQESKVEAHLRAVADVAVDPAYGKWSIVSGEYEVAANDGPPPALLGNVGAITPSSTLSVSP